MGTNLKFVDSVTKRLTEREDALPRDYSIAARLVNLAFDADREGILIDEDSLNSFVDYLIWGDKDIKEITLSPNNKIVAHWKVRHTIEFSGDMLRQSWWPWDDDPDDGARFV